MNDSFIPCCGWMFHLLPVPLLEKTISLRECLSSGHTLPFHWFIIHQHRTQPPLFYFFELLSFCCVLFSSVWYVSSNFPRRRFDGNIYTQKEIFAYIFLILHCCRFIFIRLTIFQLHWCCIFVLCPQAKLLIQLFSVVFALDILEHEFLD